ncbi:MAG: hypothetical protein EGR99_11200 [Faecalibacterium sp.]|nr:hypothetical protein [Faecalibacterium sp.]
MMLSCGQMMFCRFAAKMMCVLADTMQERCRPQAAASFPAEPEHHLFHRDNIIFAQQIHHFH